MPALRDGPLQRGHLPTTRRSDNKRVAVNAQSSAFVKLYQKRMLCTLGKARLDTAGGLCGPAGAQPGRISFLLLVMTCSQDKLPLSLPEVLS